MCPQSSGRPTWKKPRRERWRTSSACLSEPELNFKAMPSLRSRHPASTARCAGIGPFARVDISKLMLEAKAARHAEHGLDRTDWVLARAESLAALGSDWPRLVNGLLGFARSVGWPRRPSGFRGGAGCPGLYLRSFYRRAGKGTDEKAGRESRSTAGSEVAFLDVFANYNDPLIGEAAVGTVLQHNGIEVYVPPRQVGCGISALNTQQPEAAPEAGLATFAYSPTSSARATASSAPSRPRRSALPGCQYPRRSRRRSSPPTPPNLPPISGNCTSPAGCGPTSSRSN